MKSSNLILSDFKWLRNYRFHSPIFAIFSFNIRTILINFYKSLHLEKNWLIFFTIEFLPSLINDSLVFCKTFNVKIIYESYEINCEKLKTFLRLGIVPANFYDLAFSLRTVWVTKLKIDRNVQLILQSETENKLND